jgi:hypothetical protein
MTEQLRAALAEAQKLSTQDQLYLAEVVRAFIGARGPEPYGLSAEEEAAVDEGLADIARGDFVSGADAEALLRRPWK